jgi:hypothetical protein
MVTKTSRNALTRLGLACLTAGLLAIASSCSRPTTSNGVKRMPAGKEYSGFLSSYANLKPNPKFENTVSYASDDAAKNIHKYLAVIVERPVVYVSTDVDEAAVPDRGADALAEYFQHALTEAVEDAFPIVQSSGPLVLRLRSAIIGVDVGGALPADQKNGESLERAVNIGKVGVEIELVDSETGEQIAAAVDRQNLGTGSLVGSATFSHDEKFRAATEAFNGWASRLRQFLDSAEELSEEDVARVEANDFPYASQGAPTK